MSRNGIKQLKCAKDGKWKNRFGGFWPPFLIFFLEKLNYYLKFK